MAVKRRHQQDSKTKTVRLGRVLITIDSLTALRDLVAELSIRENDTAKISFGYDGSYIDDPEDLRKLSQTEREDLHVESLGVSVRLNSSDTSVWGDERATDAVQAWAENWTTSRAPADLREIFFGKWTIFVSLITTISFLANLGFIVFHSVRHEPVQVANWISLAFVVAIAIFGFKAINKGTANYAVVVPKTLSEYEDSKDTSQRWKITTLVALVAILVSAAVAFLVKLIS